MKMENSAKTHLKHEDIFFDILNCDPDTTVLPAFEGLVLLSKDTLVDVRKYFRGEEQKLRKLLYLANVSMSAMDSNTQDDLRHYISLTEIDNYTPAELEKMRKEGHTVMCDWHGLAMKEQFQLIKDGNANKISEKSRELVKKGHHCRYGQFVAEWCNLAPYPQKCGQCFTPHVADNNAAQCEHYDNCIMSTRPFLDQPCVLANGTDEDLESCRAYLHKQAEIWNKRVALVTSYINLLTAAINKCDNAPA